jgi:hypothetical protein
MAKGKLEHEFKGLPGQLRGNAVKMLGTEAHGTLCNIDTIFNGKKRGR